jgi:hypothetical protein
MPWTSQKFEQNNNVRVNVYGRRKRQIPAASTSEEINLFHDDHYSLIKNFQRFVGVIRFVCERMKCYRSKVFFDNHVAICKELNEKGSHVTVPKENTVTQFNAYKKQKPLPVVGYADCETSLVPGKTVTKKDAQGNIVEIEKITGTQGQLIQNPGALYRSEVETDIVYRWDLQSLIQTTRSGQKYNR